MMKCIMGFVLVSALALFATAQESRSEWRNQGRDGPRDALDRNEKPGGFDREIILSFEPFFEGRGFGEGLGSRRFGGHHRSHGRHHGQHSGRKSVLKIPLFEECRNFTSSMRDIFREMWTNREIGPSQCQGNFGDCIKNDMEKVRCRVPEAPSAECLAKVMQYMQGSSCTDGVTGDPGVVTGGTGGEVDSDP